MASLFTRHLHTISSSESSIITYLIQTLDFSRPKALFLSNKFSSPQSNPQSVVQFLTSLGFTPNHIQIWLHKSPKILFTDVEKTLKPTIQFFNDLGLTGPDLTNFISKHPSYLSNHFPQRLIPCVDVLKNLTTHDFKSENLIRTLRRCNWADLKQPETRVSVNVKYLEQCGIVGSQLATVITRQPRLLVMAESELPKLVSKVSDMGFAIDSRMFVHALYSVSCLSDRTIAKKIDLFRSFGFTDQEFLDMFKKAPGLLRVSEAKLRLGIGFFLETVRFEKGVLIRRPACLMYSLEQRVIPRYKVLCVLMSKGVLKKMPKFLNVMCLREDEFLEKFISKNGDDAEELLRVYKCRDLGASE